MSSQSSRRLLSRFSQDFAELRDDPYPGVAVFTDDANLRKLCLVLTPPSGPWKDLALHFDVELPDDWPSSPPKVKSSIHGIDHPNIFDSYICCDLLKGPQLYRAGNYTGGYSPALTLHGLFLQFLTFFSSTKIEQEDGGIADIGDYTVTVYLRREADITSYLSYSYYLFSGESRELERQWASSLAQEVTLPPRTDEQGAPVIITTKKVIGGASDYSLYKIQSVNPRWGRTFSLIKNWRCASCPYGSEILPHHQPADKTTVIADCTLLLQPFKRSQLEVLNNDTLLEIASHLSSESIISLSAAYTRFREVVTSFHILLHREVRCFFLRTSLHQSTLGVGIALDSHSRALSSDFDWLSMEAFEYFGVRTSIQKREFRFFLPLAFSRPHFEQARADIWKRLAVLDSATTDLVTSSRSGHNGPKKLVRASGKPVPRKPVSVLERPISDKKPHSTVTVLYRMMNNIVVSLMKSCEEAMKSSEETLFAPARAFLHASEKAITSYCHLFHLLICLSRSTPAILHDATWCLRRFVTQPETRTKKETPDLGQLIVLINLVVVLPTIDNLRPMSWDVISAHYLKEALTRNVRWVLQGAPELEVMEEGISDYRLNTTFANSKTSLRLIMFQITFLNLFIEMYASEISRLDDNYGFADKELPERMVKEIKQIFTVDTWPEFFSRVRYTHGMNFTKETFSAILRQTVQDSAARGYHSAVQNMVRAKDSEDVGQDEHLFYRSFYSLIDIERPQFTLLERSLD